MLAFDVLVEGNTEKREKKTWQQTNHPCGLLTLARPHDSPATLSHHRKAIRGRCLASSTVWGRCPGFLHRPELLPRLLHYLAQVVRSLVWNRKDRDDLVALRLRRPMLVRHICRVATSGEQRRATTPLLRPRFNLAPSLRPAILQRASYVLLDTTEEDFRS
jgi:hypothetical protein